LLHGTTTACGPSGSLGGGEFVAHALSVRSSHADGSLKLLDRRFVGILSILSGKVVCLALGVALGDGLIHKRLGGVQLALPLVLKRLDVLYMGGLLGVQGARIAPALHLDAAPKACHDGQHCAAGQDGRRDQRQKAHATGAEAS